MIAKKTISKNFPECGDWDENSFVGMLHEQRFWSHAAYWELENALYAISVEEKSELENLMLFDIFSFVVRSIGSHLDSNDFFYKKSFSS